MDRAHTSPAQTDYWSFLRAWLTIGSQSFGGGPSTLALMRRVAVEQRQWLTDEQFTRDWALCQICPGINLLGMAVLIGKKVLGGTGIVLALFGLLFPSVALTIALTGVFRLAYRTEALQAAVRGAIPATVGIGWLTCLQLGRGVLTGARRYGLVDFVFTAGLLLVSAGAFFWLRPSPILLILSAGAAGAIFRVLFRRHPEAGAAR
jgi:Chromate transport protein ChrA